MRRSFRVTAVAVALAVVLSGCSLVEDGGKIVTQLRESAAANTVLTALTTELRSRDDVESAELTLVPVTMSAGITAVLRRDATASGIADVVTRIDEALRSDELTPFERQFSVKVGDSSIRQTDFAQQPFDFAAELAYWNSVQRAIGPGITLTLGEGRDGSLQRILSTGKDSTVVVIADHADALAAITPPNGAETMWRFPGIYGYSDWLGPLPDRRILKFLAAMASVTNLLDDSVQEAPPGVYVNLPGDGGKHAPQFAFVANAPDVAVDAASTWKITLRFVREALATGLPALQIGVQSYGDGTADQASFHIGECTDVNPATPGDRKLVADLVASGVSLPDTARAEGTVGQAVLGVLLLTVAHEVEVTRHCVIFLRAMERVKLRRERLR